MEDKVEFIGIKKLKGYKMFFYKKLLASLCNLLNLKLFHSHDHELNQKISTTIIWIFEPTKYRQALKIFDIHCNF